jgi:DNA-binding transcriptional ArsR family regulator
MGDKRTGEILKTRFATIPEWILTQPEILASPTALVVYGHLFKLGDFKTRITTSDWHEIVQSTGYSKPTVMRAMKVLRECGAAVREGENVRLPMDDPGLKYETEPGDQSQIRDKSVSNMRPAPLFTENSEIVDDLNELLARRYALFAGSQPVNHKTKKWRTDMRLLLERGMSSWAKPVAIPPDAVRKRINGIFDHLATPGPSGFCWASNIRSPGSLREHWDQIGVEAKKRSSNGSRPQTIEDAQGNLIEVHG